MSDDVKAVVATSDDVKSVPPPHSSPLSLPPARAQTQPTGFPSPPITLLIPPLSSTIPPLHPVNGFLLHPSSSSPLGPPSSSTSPPLPPHSFSRSRLVAELQLGMRQVAGPSVSVSGVGGGGAGGAGGGGRKGEDDEVAALHAAFATFFSLSPVLQSECLLFYLSDGALLSELVSYFLQPTSGQANDVICQWLYDVHWNAFHPASSSSSSPASTQAGGGGVVITAIPSSPPPASLFLLHLVPVLVLSFLYRSQRSLPAPGVAAVLLGVYNVRRLSGARSGGGGRFIDPLHLTNTVYGAPSLSLPSSSPAAPTGAGAPRPASPQQLNVPANSASLTSPPRVSPPSTSASPLYPPLTELNSSSIGLLLHVVLSHYISHLSLMSLVSQQQFAYVCAVLSDNHCEGEIHRTLKEFAFAWGGEWEASLAGEEGAGGGKRGKHVKMRLQREEEEEEEDSERNGPRYQLTAQLLQDLLVGLTYCACYPGTKSLSLLSLRAIHCRAVEELMPAVLLQTTAILESVEE